MKLSRKVDRALAAFAVVALMALLGVGFSMLSRNTYASGEDNEEAIYDDGPRFVTFYDDGTKLTVRTEARTVGEALSRANIEIEKGDIVEPSRDAEINAENYYINIYRARPVIVSDGLIDKYLMTASYDAKQIAREAGVTIYDGDEVAPVVNTNFLEAGVANTYKVTRNGGRTITEEVEIPFTEETVRDVNLAYGSTEVRQLGEVGRKKVYYNVLYIDNQEVLREMTGEEVIIEPVPRITAVGVKKSLPPESATCAEWARAAGVSEADLSAAIDLIYHESGCRVDARNAHSGAYGIPQALPGSKMASAGADWETNPVTQIRWMAGYVSRYGGWQGAIEFWYAHGWY